MSGWPFHHSQQSTSSDGFFSSPLLIFWRNPPCEAAGGALPMCGSASASADAGVSVLNVAYPALRSSPGPASVRLCFACPEFASAAAPAPPQRTTAPSPSTLPVPSTWPASEPLAASRSSLDVLRVVRVHQSMTVSPQGDVGTTKPTLAWHTHKKTRLFASK